MRCIIPSSQFVITNLSAKTIQKGFILDAYPRPKKRNIRKGRTAAGKRINSENKKRHSMKKENRRGKIDF